MSATFILDLVIVLALGTMLYLVARALPRISDKTDGDPELRTPKTLIYLEKADQRFKRSSEKFLRKFRVIVLKIDNYLSNRLSSFKKDNKNGGLKIELEKDKEVENQDDSR